LIETRNEPLGDVCAPRAWRRGTSDGEDANSILQQDLSALIDEGIKLMTIEQDPARRATNAEAGLPIALNRQTHNVQGAALDKAVHGVDADAQIRGRRISIEQSRSGSDDR
jgi:hypothetical protein